MKILVTGLNGTLAPILAGVLTGRGDEVLGWDRAAVPPDDEAAARRYLDSATPTAVCHLGLGSESWAGLIAQWCGDQGAPFLFTSSAMVFDRSPDGPHRIDDLRTARDDYGRYKIRCEDLIAEGPGSLMDRVDGHALVALPQGSEPSLGRVRDIRSEQWKVETVPILPRKGLMRPGGAYLSDHYISAVAKTLLEIPIRPTGSSICSATPPG